MAKKKTSNYKPFGNMLRKLINESINPDTQRRYTFEALAAACRLSYEIISRYVNGHTLPSRNTLCDLIEVLKPSPTQAIQLARASGYDITFDSESNRHLWNKITVNRASRLDKMKTKMH